VPFPAPACFISEFRYRDPVHRWWGYASDSIAELVVFHASGSAYLQNGTTIVLAIPTSQGELWADLQMADRFAFAIFESSTEGGLQHWFLLLSARGSPACWQGSGATARSAGDVPGSIPSSLIGITHGRLCGWVD